MAGRDQPGAGRVWQSPTILSAISARVTPGRMASRNAAYTAPWAFDNDFPAFQAADGVGPDTVLRVAGGRARARKDCFNPNPLQGAAGCCAITPSTKKPLPSMTEAESLAVVQTLVC